MSPACSQALGLPEIVAIIMEQLDHRQSLFAALQVNRLWADEATMILWRVDPPIESLVQISNVERRQYYANKISSLHLRRPDQCKWDQLLNTRFPRLIQLSIRIDFEEGDKQYLSHFLQPTLRSFECDAGLLKTKSLLQLWTRCPDLRFLSLMWLDSSISTCDLVRSLSSMPSLTHLGLHGVEDVELYLHLASWPDLQELSMSDLTWPEYPQDLLKCSPILTQDVTMKILANVTNPYPKLRRLGWPAQAKAFRCLARHLSSLNVLELALVDTSDDILFAISDCANLAKMNIRFAGGSRVHAEGLLAAARKCSHLRVVKLGPTAKVDGRSITDDIIRQVATYLPTMTCFLLGIQTNLTITALLYLGERCTRLTGLYLNGDFNVEQLWRPNLAPLFPQLKELVLRKVSENVSHERAVSIFLQECPQLRLPAPSPREIWDGSIFWIS